MKKGLIFSILIASMLFFSCDTAEEEKEKITSISFETDKIKVSKGSINAVKFNVEPKSRSNDCEIEYSLSDPSSDIVELSQTSPSGFVLEAKNKGSVVLIAKCEGNTAYMEAEVFSDFISDSPFIQLPQVAYELRVDDKRSFSVTLQGGDVSDNPLFEFTSSNEDVVKVTSADNTCMIECLSEGFSKIEVSHPKSEHKAHVLVFVGKEKTNPVYITTASNVAVLDRNGGTQNVIFQLANTADENLSLFTYKITEGEDIVSMISNNNVCSLTPLKCGQAVINVSHPSSLNELELLVVVVDESCPRFITCENNFFDMKINSMARTTLGFDGGDGSKIKESNFSCSSNDENVATCQIINDELYINSHNSGTAVLTVTSSNTINPLEVYVTVGYEEDEVYYITTLQNVIRIEEGEEDYKLDINLAGGNESDRNGFSWEVSDSSVCSVTTSFGNVVNRAAVYNGPENLDACAYINALKTGNCDITVSHPKSSVDLKIKVIVCPKGSLSGQPPAVKGESVIKVLKGSEEDVSLNLISGVGNSLEWDTKDKSIATASGTGLEGKIYGISSGQTYLDVTFGNKTVYSPLILCGTQAELDSYNYLYTDNSILNVMSGQKTYIKLETKNEVNSEFTFAESDGEIASASLVNDVLVVNAKKSGECKIVVSNSECINELVLYITVYDENTVTKPYSFIYEKFFYCVINTLSVYSLSLKGADAKDINEIQWSCEDEDFAECEAGGESCRITGKKTGKTYIRARSAKSSNEARIVVYIVESEAELENLCVIDVEKTNYLCPVGKDIYVTVDVNDLTKFRSQIEWESSDISVVKIDSNYENAVLRCMGEGDAVVTVRCANALPVKIYISVRDESVINVPSISLIEFVEMEEGENVTLEAVVSNLSDEDISKLKWECSDENIVSFKANKNKAVIKAVKEGCAAITVSLASKGLSVQSQIIIYEKGAEHLPVITLSKAYYEISKGESFEIKLGYGSVYPSDSQVQSLKWESSSTCVNLTYNGNVCTVRGIEEGIAKIKVSSLQFYNELNFSVAVSEKVNSFTFDGSKIVKLVKGTETEYNFDVKDLNYNKISDFSDFIYEMEDENICNFNYSENSIVFTGLEKGYTSFTIKCDDKAINQKIMIYVFDTQAELDSAFIIVPKKENYLIKTGESCMIELDVSGDTSNSSGIKWSVSDSSIVNYEVDYSKKSVDVKAKKSGQVTFTAVHSLCPSPAVFNISITDFEVNADYVSMVSEGILLIQKSPYGIDYPEGYEGPYYSKSTRVNTSLSVNEKNTLVWSSSDTDICYADGNGENGNVTGINEGICEVTCRYDQNNYCVMVAKVCEYVSQFESSRLWNIDRRLVTIREGENIILNPVKKGNVDLDKSVYENTNEADICKCENKGGKLSITGINEGVSVIKASNEDAENEFYINVMVLPKTEGNIADSDFAYLTCAKTLYTLDPDKLLEGCEIEIMAVGLSSEDYSTISWKSSDSSICVINGNKNKCVCYPRKEGTVTVSASSPLCSNTLEITVLSSKGSSLLIPHMKSSTSSIKLKCGESSEISYELFNVNVNDATLFNYSVSDDNVCEIENLGNTVKVKGLSNGQTVLTAKYPGLTEVKTVISVSGVIDNLIYLSTSQSYSVIPVNSNLSLSVTLNGYDEKDGSRFLWQITNGNEYASISGSGKSVVVKAIKEGMCEIICSHPDALCPIKMNVNVVSDENWKPVYMSTENVVSLNDGEKKTVTVHLVNGDESENGFFSWNVPSDSRGIIKVTASGNQALVQAIGVGVGRITVSHPSCVSLPSMDIIVVVNESDVENTLVITTDQTIIEAKLSDSYKTVNVNLAGGTSEQQLLFTWEILSYDSAVRNSDGSSLPVISLVSQSGEQNIIRYLNEGTATVRVKNSATSYYLDIKFIINEYTKLQFNESSVTIDEYESATVGINCPASKTVVFNSSDEDIVRVYGTSKICCIEGIKAGYAVVTARTSDGSTTDTISVRVNKASSNVPLYITTSTSLVTMSSVDKDGYKIKASLNGKLNGKDIDDSLNDLIEWSTKSGKTDIIQFVNQSKFNAKGREVTIVPVSSGEETIVLKHQDTQRTKEIFVQIKAPDSSFSLDSVYGVYEVQDIGSVTAKLSGVPKSEEDEIIWSTSDADVVALIQDGEQGTNAKGPTCLFRCNALCEEGCVISCSYRDNVRTYTVFVKALPALRLLVSSDNIRRGQSKWYQIICSPEEYISELSYSYSSSVYTKSMENGVLLTGLVRDQKELRESKDTPPEGIKPPYFKVTGGDKEGLTTFSFECKNLSSILNIETRNDIEFNILKAVEYNKNGTVKKEEASPTIINASADCGYVRIFYELKPPVVCPEIRGAYNKDTDTSLRNHYRDGIVKVKAGDDGENYWLDIKPSGSNYGDIILKCENMEFARIKIGFTMQNVKEGNGFNFKYENGKPENSKCRYDTVNGFVTGSGHGTTGLMTLDYDENYYYFGKRDGDNISKIKKENNLFTLQNDNRIYFDSNQNGNVVDKINRKGEYTIEFEWPTGYGMWQTYKKTFVFYEETYKW